MLASITNKSAILNFHSPWNFNLSCLAPSDEWEYAQIDMQFSPSSHACLMTSRTMSIPKSISLLSNNSTIRLVVRAKPGAKRSNVVSIDDDAIGVQIAAPPRDGAANEELIEFISHVLGVKSRCVTLDVGSKSRNKVLNVNINKTAEDVLQLLKASIDN